ncbi:MAG TPA: hypothetical protein VL947_01445 [Cytophagales bacterium]|nr:hypothetical protein [Cytophagales bacterium]
MNKTHFFIIALSYMPCIGFSQSSKITEATAEDYFEGYEEVTLDVKTYTHAEQGICTEQAAKRGIFWFAGAVDEFSFNANKLRDTAHKHLEYTITEYMNGYVPLNVSFGSYCDKDTVKPFTLDLSKNAVLQIEIENPELDNYDVNIGFQLIDINGQSLVFDKGILQDVENWTKYNIGFLQDHKLGSLEVGQTKKLVYDFKDAISYKRPPFNDVNNLYPDNSNFNFSKVSALNFLVTNTETDGTSGPPLDLVEKRLHIKRFSLGLNPVVTHTEKAVVLESQGHAMVYSIQGTALFEGEASEAMAYIQDKAGLYIIKTDQKTYKVAVK